MANTTVDTYPEDYSGSLNALELIGALALIFVAVLIWVHYIAPYFEKRRIKKLEEDVLKKHR